MLSEMAKECLDIKKLQLILLLSCMHAYIIRIMGQVKAFTLELSDHFSCFSAFKTTFMPGVKKRSS